VRLAVVVVAFHRPDALDRLLAALGPAISAVVVVVEGDSQVRAVAARAGADVVDLPGNPGFAAAVNAGVAATRGDIVAVLNDDIVVTGADLDALAVLLEARGAAVVGPILVDGTGTVDSAAVALPTPGRLLLEWALLPDRPVPWLRRLAVVKWRRPEAPTTVEALAATVLVCRRDVLVAEPLPTGYFLYWEELDWFWRLHRAGHQVVLDPTVTVVHAGGRADVRPAKSRLLARNAVRCVRRTQGRPAALVAWPIVVLWQMRLLLVDLLRAPGRLPARLAGVAAAVAALREVVGS
jgi:GT2 family glycosyltransferase